MVFVIMIIKIWSEIYGELEYNQYIKGEIFDEIDGRICTWMGTDLY